jgi:hypothetical protein
MIAHPGFSAETWRYARTFGGHCATPADVEGAHAVFALGDTLNGRPLAIDKPSPVIWYDEDTEIAALVIQAETHETEEDGSLEMVGLLLPSGETAVAHLQEVEFVDAANPVWLALLGADEFDNEDDAEEDGAEWAAADMSDDDWTADERRDEDLN